MNDDFPIRNIGSTSDLLVLLDDYAKGCDAELSDISLTSSWALIGGLVVALEDHSAGKRTAARNAFFGALAARIRAVRASHAQCDVFMQREWAKQDRAARRAVNMAKENARLKTRVTELEAEAELRRSVTWPRAVNE
ncbi:hypothetical protein BjapCC829_10825 [Bradyrhizobium barranii]|uniref:Uncharacterized protein n=1 Tax=Bradyrhizobium barranii TaxID=2992140 RepID=A0ABY3QSF8_9BRAD|nr:hypothetical protein [Bradyrhizobium japonicum]UFW88956.1 hypothetical protein BjapCC829_10825 [Bradyrhizobium japonicum]